MELQKFQTKNRTPNDKSNPKETPTRDQTTNSSQLREQVSTPNRTSCRLPQTHHNLCFSQSAISTSSNSETATVPLRISIQVVVVQEIFCYLAMKSRCESR
ncbi:hypothetical protein Drorol1_Dr00007944 [Drosera rotundifolia]